VKTVKTAEAVVNKQRRNPQVPTFGEAVSSFEAHVYYFCSCKFDEASLSTVEHQEGTALHHT
jgi:hypothetical protein